MVTIADLIKSEAADKRVDVECDLVVGGQMPVCDVLERMEEAGCERIGVQVDGYANPAVLSKDELLQGLLYELDKAGEKLDGLKKQIDEEISAQLDLVRENTRSMAEFEKNQLEVAIDYMTEGLVVLGTDHQVMKCNPAAMKLFALAGNEEKKEFSDVLDDFGFRQMLTNNQKNSMENWGDFRMKSPCGAVIQIRWTEMIDESGEVIGSLAMLRDVTDELAGERAKTEFIAAITHELRTPLTIIQNSVSNILAGVTGRISKKMRKYLETIQSDCKRFGVLVADLLDISKIEGGNVLLNRQVFSLESAVDRAVCKHGAAAKEKQVELVFDTGSYVSPVYADHQRISQVLDNLIANAVKFTDSGGKVSIGCYEQNGKIITFVKDNGTGISEKQQKHVFNKFHQVGRQAGAGYKGMGLGLAICKGVVEMHGGEIWLESEEGLGSKFFFWLPKIDPSRILNRHLETMVKYSDDSSEEFALVVARFDVEESQADKYREVIGALIKEVLNQSQKFMDQKKDMPLQIGDFEVVFVVSKARKRRLDAVKAEIRKIIKNLRKNSWGEADIVPMIGSGIYPSDSNEIIEIENIARQTAVKL